MHIPDGYSRTSTCRVSTGYFPYHLKVAIPALMTPRLTVAGVLEAIATCLVAAFPGKTRYVPKRGTVVAAIAAIFLMQGSSVSAHDFWIEQKDQGLRVVFGHGHHREDFDASKIKAVRAIDIRGKEMPVRREKKERGQALSTEGSPAVVLVEIDNGYWSKTIYGWKELPKRKATRVVEAIRSLFFTKAILAWNDQVRQASSGSRIDIIPVGDPLEARAGDLLAFNVLSGGKPLQGAEVIGNDHAKLGSTDRDGRVTVPLVKGRNLITVEHKERINGDPDADALALTATLTFEVKR